MVVRTGIATRIFFKVLRAGSGTPASIHQRFGQRQTFAFFHAGHVTKAATSSPSPDHLGFFRESGRYRPTASIFRKKREG